MQRAVAGIGVVAVCWSATAAAVVWPQGLCYVNALWGGTASGYVLVSETNYDWGQGLKELARWQQQKHLDNLDVWYFGTDAGLKKLPLREVPFHNLPVHSPEEVAAQVRGHYLAVSTTFLYGAPLEMEGYHQAVAFLREARPVAQAGTFLIFDFTRSADPPAPQLAAGKRPQ
jgi:hypothetical protein